MPTDRSADESAQRQLESELTAALRSKVRVSFARSRRHAIQSRRVRIGRGADARVEYDLRLARFFGAADAAVRHDLSQWLVHGRRARATHDRLMAWIDSRFAELPARAVPTSGRRTRGQHHDLERLSSELREEPLAAELARLDPWPVIGFGRWPNRPPKRSLRLGSYEHERRWVRIHPVLDSADVPSWFVRFVLGHELLHALAAQENWDGGAPHGPQFRAHEDRLTGAARARVWQAEHTGELLRRTRRHVLGQRR